MSVEPRMDANKHELILKEEVYQVVGAAMEVSNVLGSGFLEAVYQEALGVELTDRDTPFSAQVPIRISYKDRTLDKKYIPDYFCFDQIIVEIKAVKGLTGSEEAQLLNYLRASGMPVGLLFNFGSPRLQWKRMVLTKGNIGVYSRSLADE